MTDILERLRIRAGDERRNYYGAVDAELDVEAADEIERLHGLFDKWHTIAAEQKGEIERLRAKNRELASTIATRLLDKDTKELRDEIERLRGELHSVHAHMNHLRVMYSDCIKDLREASE